MLIHRDIQELPLVMSQVDAMSESPSILFHIFVLENMKHPLGVKEEESLEGDFESPVLPHFIFPFLIISLIFHFFHLVLIRLVPVSLLPKVSGPPDEDIVLIFHLQDHLMPHDVHQHGREDLAVNGLYLLAILDAHQLRVLLHDLLQGGVLLDPREGLSKVFQLIHLFVLLIEQVDLLSEVLLAPISHVELHEPFRPHYLDQRLHYLQKIPDFHGDLPVWHHTLVPFSEVGADDLQVLLGDLLVACLVLCLEQILQEHVLHEPLRVHNDVHQQDGPSNHCEYHKVHEFIGTTHSEALAVDHDHEELMEGKLDVCKKPKNYVVYDKQDDGYQQHWHVSYHQQHHIEFFRVLAGEQARGSENQDDVQGGWE
mmetsp:Transcript_22975/g.22325  ORF Transcript_22975/g.22325 Transcript_22975/m.22325 type:complete len:369 (-) Transcript_22975:139-1245(-)